MSPSTTEAEIWERVIHPRGPMSRETAKRLLELDFSKEERQQMAHLAAKNRAGVLSLKEEELLDGYCRVGTVLSGLKSRAGQVLKRRRRIA